MTTFGLDASHYQNGLRLAGHMRLLRRDSLPRQGYVFAIAKASEGGKYAPNGLVVGYVDPSFAGFKAAARRARMLFAAYHFLAAGNISAQADNCARAVGDKSIPIMIDLEAYGARLDDAHAFRSAMAQRGYRVTLLYLPHWYWQTIGSPSLVGWNVVASSYPSSKHDYGSALYPGDNASGWAAYGGVTPVLWQFTSTGKVNGYSGNVDLDAYKGSRAQLAASGLFRDFAAKTMRPDPVKSKPKPAAKPAAPRPPLTRGPNVDPAVRSLRKATSRAAKAALKTLLRIRPWHKRRSSK